jgi:hypothetical protein
MPSVNRSNPWVVNAMAENKHVPTKLLAFLLEKHVHVHVQLGIAAIIYIARPHTMHSLMILPSIRKLMEQGQLIFMPWVRDWVVFEARLRHVEVAGRLSNVGTLQ